MVLPIDFLASAYISNIFLQSDWTLLFMEEKKLKYHFENFLRKEGRK